MSCTGDCEQGRRCTCDPARETLNDAFDLLGIIAGLVISSAVIGLLLGIVWAWL